MKIHEKNMFTILTEEEKEQIKQIGFLPSQKKSKLNQPIKSKINLSS